MDKQSDNDNAEPMFEPVRRERAPARAEHERARTPSAAADGEHHRTRRLLRRAAREGAERRTEDGDSPPGSIFLSNLEPLARRLDEIERRQTRLRRLLTRLHRSS